MARYASRFRQPVAGSYEWVHNGKLHPLTEKISDEGDALSYMETLEPTSWMSGAKELTTALFQASLTPVGTTTLPKHGHFSDVFIQLAGLELHFDAIKEFAAKYGSILAGAQSTFANWAREVVELRRVIRLSAYVVGDGGEDIGSYFVTTGEALMFSPSDKWSSCFGPVVLSYAAKDQRDAASYYVRQAFQSRLGGAAFSLGSDLRLSATGDSLLQEAWVQCALAIENRRAIRICSMCGTCFEVTGKSKRTDREYCSSTCKLRAHRARKSAAIAMYLEGKTIAEITQQFDSNGQGTVVGWLMPEIETRAVDLYMKGEEVSHIAKATDCSEDLVRTILRDRVTPFEE
jgi:hypothetical protein